MPHEANQSPEHEPNLRRWERILTVDKFIDSVLGIEAPSDATAHTVDARPSMFPPTILSAEEHRRQQDVQSRLRGEGNPWTD